MKKNLIETVIYNGQTGTFNGETFVLLAPVACVCGRRAVRLTPDGGTCVQHTPGIARPSDRKRS